MSTATYSSAESLASPLVIWVVEDSPEDYAALERAVAQPAPEAQLEHWVRAEDLIEHVGRSEERPDLMVVDLNLPGIDGAELVARLRTSGDPHLSKVPVCVLSSSTREADERRCREAGADDYRVKPARIAALREVAAHAVALARPAGS